MIKHQLAAVPARKCRGETAEERQHQPAGQDLIRMIETQAGIGGRDSQQHHSGDGVVPACNAHANAGNGQQFGGSGNGCQHAEREGCAGGPFADLYPKGIGGPPIEDIDTERRDDERDGEMHHHGMDGMTGDGDGGVDVLFRNGANDRIGMIGANFGWRFFRFEFPLFRLLRSVLRHKAAFLLKSLLLAATPMALAGCGGALSTLDPAGPRAANLATLWWVMLAGSIALFAIVIVLFGLAYIRTGWITRITPAQWIVGGGLILPIPILIMLTGTALVLGEQLLPKGGAPLRISAEAQRWNWTFRYPDGSALEAGDVLHIPAGQPVDIAVTSSDVIHSFWVPRLGGKIDAIPGHTNLIRLEADKPGTYWGVCAEYCGPGHDTMLVEVQAHSAEDFAALLGGQAP